MGRVYRQGMVPLVQKTAKRHQRNCRSAPAVPTGVAMTFHRREMGRRDRWRARVVWDPVDEDVAGRSISVEAFQVQYRATDASGDPVETTLQDEARRADGIDFSVHSGSAPSNKNSRELNAAGDVIKKTITGLTTGIATQVNFYAREDLAASAPRLQFEVWNVTDGVTLGAKNETLSGISPKLYVTRTFTPVVGKTYEARISWVSGTGIGLFDHLQWHDLGNVAQWTQMIPSDENPLQAVFVPIPRPKSWYGQTRVRALNRTHGARCWSAWSAWTTPQNPVTGALVGPPPPTSVTLVLDKVEGSRPRPWRAKVRWNEVPWWFPPDDDPVLGAAGYHIQLAVSNNGGTTTANVRRKTVESDDSDGNATANCQFLANIRGKRHYRARVKAYDEQGRRGAWSSWTAWASPGGAPSPPLNLTWSNPTPAVLRAKWDDPADPSDIDKYRVRVFRKPGPVLVEDAYAFGNRFTYHIPAADRANVHFVRVTSIEGELVLDVDEDTPLGWDVPEVSTDVDSADVTPTATWTSAEAPPSDGLVPTSSPTPTVQGGIGFLYVKWTLISNPDTTTYEVHVSTTTGFTPGAGTLAGEVDGSFFFIRKMPDNSALAYGTTYYVKLIAKDRDGAAAAGSQGSATLTQINTADIAADQVTANEILVSNLAAISADLGTVTAGSYATAASGTRWRISSANVNTIQGFVSTNDLEAAVTVSDHSLVLSAPYDTGDFQSGLRLDAALLAANAILFLMVPSGRVSIEAAEIELHTGQQARGFCAVQAYNGHGTLARLFGSGVTYGGVTTLTNPPSSITLTTVGTDQNVSNISAADFAQNPPRGFRLQADIAAASQGRVSRDYVTVGN